MQAEYMSLLKPSQTISFIKKEQVITTEGFSFLNTNLELVPQEMSLVTEDPFYFWELWEPPVSLQSESKVLCWDDVEL